MFEARFGNEYLESAPDGGPRRPARITLRTLRRCSLGPMLADDLHLVHRRLNPKMYRDDVEEPTSYEDGWSPAARTSEQTAAIVALFRRGGTP